MLKAAPRLLFLLLTLLAALLSGPARGVQAQAAPVSLEEYETLLREALASAQRNDEIGLGDTATRLVPIREVLAPDGTPLAVDNSWLGRELDQRQPNIRIIRLRLGAQVEILAAARTATPADLAVLKDILSKPPFAEDEPEESDSFLSGIGGFFEAIFDFLFGPGQFASGCLTVLAVLVVTGVVYYLGMALRGSFRGQARPVLDPDDEVAAENLTSVKALDRASEVAVEGDFRKAVRYLYLSTLLWLDEHGAVRYDRTLTNREVLAALPPASPLRSRLSPVVGTFDQVWYGFKEIDQAAFDAFRQQVTALREGR